MLSLQGLSYEECLKKLGLNTLAYQRAKGDMIEVCKVMTGNYNTRASPDLGEVTVQRPHTIGNGCKLEIHNAEGGYNLWHHFFTSRVTGV